MMLSAHTIQLSTDAEPAPYWPRISYTVSQAVVASGIGRTTLYSLMGSGELPFVKLGNRTLIRHVDLEHLLQRHVAPAKPCAKR